MNHFTEGWGKWQDGQTQKQQLNYMAGLLLLGNLLFVDFEQRRNIMLKIIRTILGKIYKNIKLVRSIPSFDNCMKQQLSIKEAEAKMLTIINITEDSQLYDSILQEHEKWKKKYWNSFISKIKTGDELWYCSTPDLYWTLSMGYDGFMILRKIGNCKSKIVATLIYRRA
jgi:hypothetical protein